MMTITESTSAEAFNQYLRGKLIAASNGWKNLLVRVYSEPRVEESVIYPAVAEPRIVRILSGAAAVEERELGGPWLKTRVEAGNFFLTASQSPSEVRWRAIGPEPLETMHVYLGLPVFNRAIEEAFHIEFSRDLRLRLPAVDDHFHRLTLELLLILLLYTFLFHGSLYSTLSFRVRQIGGVSRWLFFLGRWRGQQSLSRS